MIRYIKQLWSKLTSTPTPPQEDITTPPVASMDTFVRHERCTSVQLRMMGVAACAVVYSPLLGYTIVTDELFDQFTDNTKAFFIQHEIGHVLGDHLRKLVVGELENNRIEMILEGRVHHTEIEADHHAVSVVGKDNAIAALEEIIAHKDILGMEDYAVQEVKNRIEIIKHIN